LSKYSPFQEAKVKVPYEQCEWLKEDGMRCCGRVVEGTGAACALHRADALLFQAEVEAEVDEKHLAEKNAKLQQYEGVEPCAICGEDMESHGTVLDCGHRFHGKCILQWYRGGKSTCPTCRDDPLNVDASDTADTQDDLSVYYTGIGDYRPTHLYTIQEFVNLMERYRDQIDDGEMPHISEYQTHSEVLRLANHVGAEFPWDATQDDDTDAAAVQDDTGVANAEDNAEVTATHWTVEEYWSNDDTYDDVRLEDTSTFSNEEDAQDYYNEREFDYGHMAYGYVQLVEHYTNGSNDIMETYETELYEAIREDRARRGR